MISTGPASIRQLPAAAADELLKITTGFLDSSAQGQGAAATEGRPHHWGLVGRPGTKAWIVTTSESETGLLLAINKWIGRAARGIGIPLNWTSVQVSCGSPFDWHGWASCPSYAACLIACPDHDTEIQLGQGTGETTHEVGQLVRGAVTLMDPGLATKILSGTRVPLVVVAFQHPERSSLNKASSNRLKALGFNLDVAAAWIAPAACGIVGHRRFRSGLHLRRLG